MSSLMASDLSTGAGLQLHPLVLYGLTSAAALLLIGVSGVFLAQSVTAVAMTVQPSRTERQVWYVPTDHARKFAAADFDIARLIPVSALDPKVGDTEHSSALTHTVGVESLRVRSGPSKLGMQVFALKGGTPVSAGRIENGWVEITDGEGRTGWVYSSLLNRTP